MYNGKTRPHFDFPTLDVGDFAEIQQLASAGLSKEDIIKGFSMEWSDLIPEEQQYFMEHFNYGRVRGLFHMSDNLFKQARDAKNGAQAAIAWLQRFSPEWKLENPNQPMVKNITVEWM